MTFKYPGSFADFLKTGNTGNTLHDMAVAFANLSAVEADALQNLRDMIVTKTDELSQITELMSTLRGYRPTTTDNASKAADDGTKSDLGTTQAESLALLSKLKFWGVEINDKDVDKSGGDSKPYRVNQGTYDQWLTMLQSASDTVMSKIKELQTTTESLLDQWSKFLDWVSTFIKKNGENFQAVTNNFRLR
jgi:hypothetical protein